MTLKSTLHFAAANSLARIAVLWAAALTGFFGVLWLEGQPSSACSEAQAPSPQAQAGPAAAAAQKPPPGHNFALAANGGKASGGINPQLLIDGDDVNYTSGTGFANTTWSATPPPFFLVALKEPVSIDHVRFLLWDRDEERYYRYRLEVCADEKGEVWTVLADRTGPTDQCRSWQTIAFGPRRVKLIRLTGTYNSANSGFHVVELQASMGMPAGAEPPSPDGLDF
ncbi:MAG: discoidin domain-containing protein [Planctomycetota bacterium]|nr:discoidin domain-containing protein [Planctomycetota bacterium]